jgi:hypothetical protein
MQREQLGHVKPFSINPKSFRESTRGDLLRGAFAQKRHAHGMDGEAVRANAACAQVALPFPRPKDSFPKEPFGSEKQTAIQRRRKRGDAAARLQPQHHQKTFAVLVRGCFPIG